MAITFKLQTYSGAGPSWADVDPGTHKIVFSGNLTDIAVAIQAREFQDGSHLGLLAGTPGEDQCGANHVRNCKWLADSGASSVSLNGGAAQNITAVVENECTFRCRLYDDTLATHATQAGRLFAYYWDASNPNIANPAEAVDIAAFCVGEGATAWTHINDATTAGPTGWTTGNIGGDNTDERIDWQDRAAAYEHKWPHAFSIAPESAGAKAHVGIGAHIEYT